jgi:hypothetical protein
MRMAWMGLLWFMAGVAWSPSGAASDRDLEASMTVSGSLTVDEKGNVMSHAVDHPEQLPPGVMQAINQTLPTFRFQPALRNGLAHAVDAKMSLRVVANQIDPDRFAVRIRSARFTESDTPPGEQISVKSKASMQSMMQAAIRADVGGTVYVALRIDRGGNVIEAQTQQVNLRLRTVPIERDRRRARDILARATVAAVRKFTFNIPTSGPHASDAEFTGVLPVSYMLGTSPPQYGQWDAYVPGPRESITWLDDKENASSSEAVPAGTFAQAGTALTLLTPLGGG